MSSLRGRFGREVDRASSRHIREINEDNRRKAFLAELQRHPELELLPSEAEFLHQYFHNPRPLLFDLAQRELIDVMQTKYLTGERIV